MRLALLLIFIAVPLLEIALLVKAGDSFGFWPTIAIIVVTAILGTLMLRWQGISVLMRAQDALREGRIPVESVADGAFLLLAGAFLLTPGLITDSLGFAFMVPKVRRWLGKKIFRAASQHAGFDQERGAGGHRTKSPPSSSKPTHDQSGNPIIDAEFEELDPK